MYELSLLQYIQLNRPKIYCAIHLPKPSQNIYKYNTLSNILDPPAKEHKLIANIQSMR